MILHSFFFPVDEKTRTELYTSKFQGYWILNIRQCYFSYTARSDYNPETKKDFTYY